MNQFIEIDGVETRICGGGFGIFGHGNVPCLGEALYPVQDELPLYRGQNEQSMGFRRRGLRQVSSAPPLHVLHGERRARHGEPADGLGARHANRLPMLMLCGDTFLTRLPDPVLQQLEHFGNPALGLNDAFKAVTRYWDRITHPAQIIQSLPAALATMLDPADCGPAFLGLPQDVQGWAYDYPAKASSSAAHPPHPPAGPRCGRDCRCGGAAEIGAERPMIIAGGGVQYSGAVAELTAFAEGHAIPVVETIAGRANMLATHPLNIGPDRRDRIGQRQRHRRTGRRDPRRRHAPAGFHHRIMDGLRKDARFIGLNVGAP
jgi:3D-(3,5/4)-trihydroxycyclohexane-1,2-dione acylhydrolase (decyclizing)